MNPHHFERVLTIVFDSPLYDLQSDLSDSSRIVLTYRNWDSFMSRCCLAVWQHFFVWYGMPKTHNTFGKKHEMETMGVGDIWINVKLPPSSILKCDVDHEIATMEILWSSGLTHVLGRLKFGTRRPSVGSYTVANFNSKHPINSQWACESGPSASRKIWSAGLFYVLPKPLCLDWPDMMLHRNLNERSKLIGTFSLRLTRLFPHIYNTCSSNCERCE